MESQIKRPRRPKRAVATRKSEGNAQASTSQQHHHQSSQFHGSGVQNHDGSIVTGRDLIVNNFTTAVERYDKDRRPLLESLRFEQIDTRHSSINKAYASTCRWFLQTSTYVQWEENDSSQEMNRFLWIKGKPGAGKSTLMKFLHQQVESKTNMTNAVLISFFFNARGHELEKSTIGLYRSLLVQLLEKQPHLQQVLSKPNHYRGWDVDSLGNLFIQAIQNLAQTPVICLIDALDECEERQIREMVNFFSDLTCTENQLSICFASRHYPHITIETGLSIVLEEQDEHQHDIATYLGRALRIGHSPLAERIRLDLQKKASGVFMWVVLVVEILNKEYDAGRMHTLREKVKQLPANLHELFRDILTRDASNREALLLCIQWILFAERPLTPKELYFAILSGYEPQHLTHCHSGDISDEDMMRYILNHSKGLAESTKAMMPTIQFIHESVRDFLLKDGGLSEVFPSLRTNVDGQGHEALKHCCSTYLNTDIVVKAQLMSPQPSAHLRSWRDARIWKPSKPIGEELPFLGYAVHGILHHAEQAQDTGINQWEFLVDFPRKKWIMSHNLIQKHKISLYTSEASLLYILAEFDMPALIRACRSHQSCFDIENERYGVPILAASAMKSVGAVQVLLELESRRPPRFSWPDFASLIPSLDAKFYSSHTRNFTFKSMETLDKLIIEYGSEAILVFQLLRNAYDDGIYIRRQRRDLFEAALKNGYRVLFDKLIQKDIHFVRAFSEMNKLLMSTRKHKGKDLIELFIMRCTKTSAVGKSGRTPLLYAFHHRYISLAELLIERGVAISTADEKGTTPLQLAIIKARTDIAKLLIQYSADISVSDPDGRTALHFALIHRNVEVATLLVQKGADTSIMDKNGVTPLYLALVTQQIEVAELLVAKGADIPTACVHGKTPLHLACKADSLELARLIIARGADIDGTDNKGKSPIYYASRKDEGFDMFNLLVNLGANISVMDKEGRTPLHHIWRQERRKARQRCHLPSRVIRSLIKYGFDLSNADGQGRTLLHYAVRYGRKRDVKLLIKHGADISKKDKKGRTLLHYASRSFPTVRDSMVKLVKKRGVVG